MNFEDRAYIMGKTYDLPERFGPDTLFIDYILLSQNIIDRKGAINRYIEKNPNMSEDDKLKLEKALEKLNE